ncbi:MAG: arginine--tRNA ligase [Lactobacillales bacterium]|nr:arginine--tRNA ligase [Lactobacillales bacterium]
MILKILENIIKEELNKLNYEVDAKVIKSNRPDLCDYQFDGVFKLASIYKKSPIEIGEEIVACINERGDFSHYFSEVSFVKPGFINIKISDTLINELLVKMNENDKFNIEQKNDEVFFLDYGGPNIAKPLHVGHLRSAIVGEAVKRTIEFKGYKTISDVHLGDYGLQIGQVIYAIKRDNINIEDITLEYLENVYPKISALCKQDEEVKKICADITKDLQDGNLEYHKYFEKIKEVSGNDIKRLYKYLNVKFDLWYGESDAYNYIEEAKNIIDSKKLFKMSEGALVVEVKEDTDKKEMPPLIFEKSNGAYLYGTTDIATILQREQDYKPDHILYFTDLRQQMHFEQVFRTVKKAGITDANLEFLGFGTVNGKDGKPYKTRSGDAPKLDDLFNEVKELFISKKEENKSMSLEDRDKIVNAIIKFADLQNNREKDYIFDIEKFSEVVGKTGPYILYTYLRINKIIENKEITTLNDIVYNDYDRNLRIKLLELELAVNNAFNTRMPSYIAEYIYDLCVLVNSFYQNNHVNNEEDKDKQNSFVYVLNLTNKIIKEMLNILVIDIPSVM